MTPAAPLAVTRAPSETPDTLPLPPPRARIEPGLRARLTFTDNANFAPAGQTRNDVLAEVAPSLALHSDGPRLRASGEFEFIASRYLDNSQRQQIAPHGRLQATLEPVPKSFFIDASVSAAQIPLDPFAARDSGIGNTFTATQYRVSPYLRGASGPELRYEVRSDSSWTHSINADLAQADAFYGHQAALIERTPLPLGAILRYDRSDTHFREVGAQTLTDDVGRVIVEWALSPQFMVAARGGWERNNFAADQRTGSLHGASLSWRPTERTEAHGYWERRFFGNGWDAGISHRLPGLAINVQGARDISTFPQTVLSLSNAGNVATLLDALLTTRIPDPAQRAIVVKQIIDQQRLPGAIGGPTGIYSNGVSLVQTVSGNIAVLGNRSALALALFRVRTELLPGTGTVPLTLFTDLAVNNVQQGASLTFSRALAPQTTLIAVTDWTRIAGLAEHADSITRQTSVRIELNRQLAPHTDALLGVRRQRIISSATNDAQEEAVFVGIAHKFH